MSSAMASRLRRPWAGSVRRCKASRTWSCPRRTAHALGPLDPPSAGKRRRDGGAGATCLYIVYDPVTRRCTMARAGHLPPAIVDPDGHVSYPEVPAGPPLGLGPIHTVPYAATELTLPEGSLIALFTDGLVESRDQDIDSKHGPSGDRSRETELLPRTTLFTGCRHTAVPQPVGRRGSSAGPHPGDQPGPNGLLGHPRRRALPRA